MWHRTLIRPGLAALVAVLLLAPARAQSPRTPGGPTDPFELEAFFDGLVSATLDAYHIAGATVSVVRDGRRLLAKGYGLADVDRRTPVSADSTSFRIGSISKLFVWTSVMQLVEQGKVDLNADVNTYLKDFQIPATYRQPVTLASLMTHSAGFEDRVIGLFARDSSGLTPLGDILARELPARVRPPGDVSSYSNHGTAIAAYIVEGVSGEDWDDYVRRHILEPLAMARTTFRQPVPSTIAATQSVGYAFRAGELQAQGFEYVPLAPVGAASSTAADMANFMIAHLQRGRFGGARILADATAETMQGELFRQAPGVNPMEHGFIDMSTNGQHVIGHGGDTLWFHSMLALVPEHNLGLFVSFNAGGGQATGRVYREFMNHYFPQAEPPAETLSPGAAARLRRFAGSYRSNRYSHRDLTILATAFGVLTVDVADRGELRTIGSETIRWLPTGPLTFREAHGARTLAFREDARGRITHLFVGEVPFLAFERLAGLSRPAVQLAVLIATMMVFVVAIVSWPVAAIARWHYGLPAIASASLPVPARWTAWSAAVLLVAFAAGLAVMLGDSNEIVFGVPATVKGLLLLPVAAGLFALGTLVSTAVIWRRHRGGLWGRVAYTIVALALVASLWQINHWNLLGFRY